MRLNDEELELVSIARGQNIDEMVAVVEHIVAARVAGALAPITPREGTETLAEVIRRAKMGDAEMTAHEMADVILASDWMIRLRAALSSHEGIAR